jgi:hypothetical protein
MASVTRLIAAPVPAAPVAAATAVCATLASACGVAAVVPSAIESSRVVVTGSTIATIAVRERNIHAAGFIPRAATGAAAADHLDDDRDQRKDDGETQQVHRGAFDASKLMR